MDEYNNKLLIMESIKIINIINHNYHINYFEIIFDIINDPILSLYCKKLLIEYCENKYVHSHTLITFEKLLCYVWIHINNLHNKNDIKSKLNIEILFSQYYSVENRISTLLYCIDNN